MLAISEKTLYNVFCCGMIAVKREVAAFVAGFPWSECQVRKLTTSHCTNFNGLPKVETTCGSIAKRKSFLQETHGYVYSHRLSYYSKVRKGGDFFYGKSSNENHSQGL
jgi:hypothetical protein